MSLTILTTHDLVCGYQINHPLTSPLNIVVNKNDIVAILGVNGRGKTTLLHTLMGINQPLSGKFDCRYPCCFVPQNFTCNIDYALWEIVVMGSVKQWGLFGQPDKKTTELVRDNLAQLGLEKYYYSPFSQLSGGQKQLALIARALLTKCKILLLDEPTNALDLYNQKKVLNILASLVKQQDLTIIFTTHDPAHAMSIANKVLLLDNKQYQYGSTHALLTENNLSQLYHITMKKIVLTKAQTIIPIYDQGQ